MVVEDLTLMLREETGPAPIGLYISCIKKFVTNMQLQGFVK